MTLLGLLFLDLGKRDFFFFNRGRTEGSWELVGAMTYHDTDLYSLIDLGPRAKREGSHQSRSCPQPQDRLGGTKIMHSEGSVLF